MTGGRATRLAPLTEGWPKHLMPVLDRPILDWTLDAILRSSHVGECTVVTGHLHAAIEATVARRASGRPIRIHYDGVQSGYWPAIAPLLAGVAAPVVLWIGDSFIRADVDRLLETHFRHGRPITAAAQKVPYATPSRGVYELLAEGVAHAYAERSTQAGELVNLGLYVLEPDRLRREIATASTAADVLPVVAARDGIAVHPVDAYARNINSPTDLLETNIAVLNGGRIVSESADVDAPLPMSGLFVGERVSIAGGATLRTPVIVGRNATVGVGAHVEECLVLPGARVPAGVSVRAAIIGADVVLPAPLAVDVTEPSCAS